MLSDKPVDTGTLDAATGPGMLGWQGHVSDLRAKLGDCAGTIKDHAGRLTDCENRLEGLEKDPSGARVTVSDRAKGRSTAMTARKLQAQIEAHRTVRNVGGI